MRQALFRARVGRWGVPGRRQIIGKPHQGRAIDDRTCRRLGVKFGETMLQRRNTLEHRVPARLEFARHMALGRIDEIVAAGRKRRLVTRLFKFSRDSLANVVRRAGGLIGGQHRGFDGAVRHGFQDCRRDRTVDAHAANPNAQPRSDMTIVAATLVAVRVAGSHPVEHAHHAPAQPAAHKAGQKSATAARRLTRGALLHMSVLPQHRLVLLELRPGQITFVVVANQHVPVRHSAAMTAGLASAPVNDAGALASAPKCIRASVDRDSAGSASRCDRPARARRSDRG